MEPIHVPQPDKLSVKHRMDLAIQISFDTLLAEAKKLDLPVDPKMKLSYMSDEPATKKFEEACREILTETELY